MNSDLTAGAGKYLELFDSETDQQIIEKCIVNYSFTPITFGEKISMKLYMIFEAFAHIFNISDRDYALDAVQRRVLKAPIHKYFSNRDIVWFSKKSLDFAVWDQRTKCSNGVTFLYEKAQNIDQYVQKALQVKNDITGAAKEVSNKITSLIKLITGSEGGDDIFDVATLERISKKAKDNQDTISLFTKKVVENKSNIKGFFDLVSYAVK